MRGTLSERLWARVDVRGPDNCWPFTGARQPNGYGVLGRGGRGAGNVMAHVAAYEDKIGPVPAGYQVDHVQARGCAGGACCNPAHLEAVTQLENLRRQAAARTTCPSNHPWDEANTYRQPRTGARACRECHRQRERARKQRLRAAAAR